MRVVAIVALCVGLTLLSACTPPEQPEFRTLNDVEFAGADLRNGTISLTANAVFHNPNGIKLQVTELELLVFLDGEQAATVNQAATVSVAANADFTLPIQAELPLQVVADALKGDDGSLLGGLLAGKQLDVRVDGWVRVKLGRIELKAPVQHQETVEIRL